MNRTTANGALQLFCLSLSDLVSFIELKIKEWSVPGSKIRYLITRGTSGVACNESKRLECRLSRSLALHFVARV